MGSLANLVGYPGGVRQRLDQIESAFPRFDYEPKLEQEILRIGRDNNQVREFTSQIKGGGSSRIYLEDKEKQNKVLKCLRRQPDGQFGHKEAEFPGVVIEVSYSQDGKQLSKIAKQYIHYTDGNIKAVICLDINYGNTQSTVSLWKPQFNPDPESDDPDSFILDFEQTVQAKPFRTADGKPLNPENSLTLHLHDFAPDQSCQGVPNIPILISFAKICEFLDDAEKVQNARESRGTSGIRSTRKLRKRELSSSSLEELAQDDEARFKEQEEAVDTRASHRDDAFVPRPGDANIIHRDHDLRPRAAKRRA
ncbi:hypothetical protein V3481_006913 [Fusarium oxysporum f. sp. vasinfectum]